MGLGAGQEAPTHPALAPPEQCGRFLQWQAQGASGLSGRQQGAGSTGKLGKHHLVGGLLVTQKER